MGSQQCRVCKDAPSKYKCPTCITPYCSLPCYKQHKETPCVKLEPSVQVDVQEQPIRSFEENEDEKGFRLRRSQLEAIAASDEICHMLKDPKLQRLIGMIDSSSNAKQDLNKAMKGQSFQEFTDKILAILNPEDQSLVTV